MSGFFIETTRRGRRAVAVRVLGETPTGYRVQVLVDCVSPSRRRVPAGGICFVPRAYLRLAVAPAGERAGDQAIVAVTLHPTTADAGPATPVRRALPGVVLSHEELVARLGRKSWTPQTIEA